MTQSSADSIETIRQNGPSDAVAKTITTRLQPIMKIRAMGERNRSTIPTHRSGNTPTETPIWEVCTDGLRSHRWFILS